MISPCSSQIRFTLHSHAACRFNELVEFAMFLCIFMDLRSEESVAAHRTAVKCMSTRWHSIWHPALPSLWQAREVQPQEKTQARPILVAVGLLLAPDAFHMVLDADNTPKGPGFSSSKVFLSYLWLERCPLCCFCVRNHRCINLI